MYCVFGNMFGSDRFGDIWNRVFDFCGSYMIDICYSNLCSGDGKVF